MKQKIKTTAPYHIAQLPKAAELVSENSILSQTIFTGATVKAILFTFAAGQELSEHTSSSPAILHFLSGEAQISLGEESFSVEPGSWVYMEPKLPHSVFAQTAVVMLLEMLPRA